MHAAICMPSHRWGIDSDRLPVSQQGRSLIHDRIPLDIPGDCQDRVLRLEVPGMVVDHIVVADRLYGFQRAGAVAAKWSGKMLLAL